MGTQVDQSDEVLSRLSSPFVATNKKPKVGREVAFDDFNLKQIQRASGLQAWHDRGTQTMSLDSVSVFRFPFVCASFSPRWAVYSMP